MRISILSVILASACVSTHYGEAVSSSDKVIHVSCQRNHDLSTDYYFAATCTFENVSDQWQTITVDSARLLPPASAELMSAADVHDFATAMRFEREMIDHNATVLLAGLAVAGAATAAVSDNSRVANVGVGTAVASIVLEEGRLVAGAAKTAEIGGAARFGAEHVLGGSIRLPARLFVRKQVLFALTDRGVVPSAIEICQNGECMTVPLPAAKRGT